MIKNKSFTFIDLVAVLIVIALLTGAFISITKPIEFLKQSRDIKRTGSIEKIDSLLDIIKKENPRFNELNYASSNVVYLSLPDNSPTCSSYISELPTLPSGWSYRCVATPTNIDGTGWIPISLKNNPLIDISSLPVDPINKPPYYYTFVATSGAYEFTILQEKDNKEVVISTAQTRLTPITRVAANFVKAIGGPQNEVGNFAQRTSDGGYIITGRTNSYSARGQDIFVIKLNTSGSVSWAKIIGGANDDFSSSIRQTSDGGYIITGFTNSYGNGGFDILVIKLNTDGSVRWAETIGGTNTDSGAYIQETSDGGYILVGRTNSFGAGNSDILVIKLNADGSVRWAETIGGGNDDLGSYIQETTDRGYILVGHTQSFGAGNYDIIVIKLDSSGGVLWSKTIGGSNVEYGLSGQQTADGGYILVGRTNSFGSGSFDIFVVKIDSLGNFSWAKTIGGNSADYALMIQQTADRGYIVGGFTNSFGAGNFDVFIVKLDELGNFSWAKTIGGTNDDRGYYIQETTDGGFFVSGYTYSYGSGNQDIITAKLDSSGNCGNCSLIKDAYPNVPSLNLNLPLASPATSSVTFTPNPISSETMVVNDVSPSVSTLCSGQ